MNSSHHSPATRISSGLQFQDISHLPITYPSPTPPSINHHQQQLQQEQEHEQRRTRLEGEYVDDDDGQSDEDDEWELDREYIDVGAADTYGGYDPVRPRPVHRDSDVEFGNRLTSMRSLRGRGRTSIRIPHMMHMKGLQRGKTALIRTLQGGLRRANIHGHLHHSSGSGHSPPFEFRDPQPAPASIRQQYAELSPPESSPGVVDQTGGSEPATHEMRTENGLLAPPVIQNGPNPSLLLTTTSPTTDKPASVTVPADANSRSERRHSRSRSAIYQSQSRPNSTHSLRPRSRSVGSHRSASSAETVVAPNVRAQMYDNRHRSDDAEGEDDDGDGEDTAETTLVQHVNDLTLTPIHLSPSKSPSKASRHSNLSFHPHRYSRPHDVRFPRRLTLARYHHSRSGSRLGGYTSKTKASLVRAIQAFNRLPWMAAPEDPRGALFPSDYYPTPRITKDFVPTRSGRAKLHESLPPGSGLVYKKENVSLQELENAEGYGSWYLPSKRQLQRNVTAQYYRDHQRSRVFGANVGAGGLGGNIVRPVKQAYGTYRAVTARSGRPLDYMYAPAIASESVVTPSIYSTRQHSHANYDGHLDKRREGTASVTRSRSATGSVDREVGAALYGVGSRPGSIAAAASAYLARSASASQASSSAGSQGRKQTAVEYAANGGTNVPPSALKSTGSDAGLQDSRSLPQAQNQSQNQQQQLQYPVYTYAYAYPTSQSQIQGHEAQYYTYNFAYPQPQSQSYSRTRVPGSSPPLPPVPVAASTATSGYTESGSIPTIPSVIDHSASTGSSQLAEYSYARPHEHRHRDRHEYEHKRRREYDDGYWSGHSYSYEREHGHGYGDRHRRHREPASGGGHFGRSASGSSSGSGSSTDSGYRTTGSIPVGVNPGRYADYAYSAYVR